MTSLLEFEEPKKFQKNYKFTSIPSSKNPQTNTPSYIKF